VAEEIGFDIASWIGTVGISWGYAFVLTIAGCSLILAYYVKKGKLIVRSPFGLPKDKDKQKSGEDSSDEKV